MKILYIEDDKEDRYLFQDALKFVNNQIEFDSAVNCDEALLKLKTQKPPDLIFLDINLPLRSGLDCLKVIKSNPLLGRIPVIIYSASNIKKDIIECLGLGASKYLIKPYDLHTLCIELATCFDIEADGSVAIARKLC
jgi:CheY-like chemotaxis protein